MGRKKKNLAMQEQESYTSNTQPGRSHSLPLDEVAHTSCFPKYPSSWLTLPAWFLGTGSCRSLPSPSIWGRNDHLKEKGMVQWGEGDWL